ncbi:MAG TPA: hypothetical protein VJ652_20795 [Noviherbaspirillum sp.]|nr:hypothetical protein [Noviherbaspirillum sp.]
MNFLIELARQCRPRSLVLKRDQHDQSLRIAPIASEYCTAASMVRLPFASQIVARQREDSIFCAPHKILLDFAWHGHTI